MIHSSIGKITLVALLIATFVLGAFLSYMWVVGYYVSLGLKIPEKPVISISNIKFNPQRTTSFNITILNPTLSSSEVKILGISVLTENGTLYEIKDTVPTIPSNGYTLQVGESKTFHCFWEWGAFTGQSLKVMVFIADGSGGTIRGIFPLVNLTITDFQVDPLFANRFRLIISNSENSATYVNLTLVRITSSNGTEVISAIEPALPQKLEPNASISLIGYWDWSSHQNEMITIQIETAEGYTTRSIKMISTYVTFSIGEVSFNASDTLHFNLTIINSETSIIPVNITKITVTLENETVHQVTPVTPALPYVLDKNATVTFHCSWNWTDYRDKTVTITVTTLEGYTASSSRKTPHNN
ncbi:MAG: hypothetical protein QXX08_08280 [Candidatus Bathyarchaeia archaeon]